MAPGARAFVDFDAIVDDHAMGNGVCRNETLEVGAQNVAEAAPGSVAGTSEQRAFRLVVVYRVDAQADVLVRVQDRDVVLDPAEHFIAQVPWSGSTSKRANRGP